MTRVIPDPDRQPGPAVTVEDRYGADVFGATYRELPDLQASDYRWRVVVPEAVTYLRKAGEERWSFEKLADYLHTDAGEAGLRFRRFLMSERVNAGQNTPERISLLFREWLERFEPDERERKNLARDLSRLLSSQLFLAAEAGESLESVVDGLEKTEAPPPEKPAGGSWGPQWRD